MQYLGGFVVNYITYFFITMLLIGFQVNAIGELKALKDGDPAFYQSTIGKLPANVALILDNVMKEQEDYNPNDLKIQPTVEIPADQVQALKAVIFEKYKHIKRAKVQKY